jgi:acyl-[acyl-carrier-protein]-phospholipid O-acyltransferase / long-chain-fatty-acid--[acyl-carrier-protein] ligase
LMRELTGGQTVMIFPEGRLSQTGRLMKVYDGTALMALQTGAHLLPIHIDGAHHSRLTRLSKVLRLRWLPQITLTILPPQPFTTPHDATGIPLHGHARRQQARLQLQDVMSHSQFASTPTNQTVFSALLTARTRHGGNLAIINDLKYTPLTYTTLVARALMLAPYFKPLAGPFNTVGIMLPNANATMLSFLAAHAAGVAPTMVNFTAGRVNILSGCAAAGVTHIVTSRAFVTQAKLDALTAELTGHGLRFVYLEDLRENLTLRDKARYLIARIAPQCLYRPAPNAPKQPAVILFTSGSEGAPKAVVLTHQNLLANAAQLNAVVDFNSADRVLNALPMFHSFGLTGGTLVPLLHGVPIFLYPTPLHYRAIPEMAYGLNSTVLFGTDTFLANYARVAHPYDFYSVRYVFAGGEKLQATTRQQWQEKFGLRVLEGYGTTEAAPALTMNVPLAYRAGSVGRLLPGVTVRLTPLPAFTHEGTVGYQLEVTGPNIMAGYWRATNPGVLEAPREGWYDTGDVVQQDAQGFITLVGRRKRFAKIGGEMISLTQLETLAKNCWPHALHGVIAQPDARKGEQLVLFTTQPTATLPALRAFILAAGGSPLLVPKTLRVIDKLPLLATGKTDYPALQQLYLVS